jgi:hypothetical protein
MVSALVEIGELDRARRLCERLLSAASPLGLYGEEIDPETGRHLGNFPQAFTHLALINAVLHVIDADRRAAESAMPLSPRAKSHPQDDEMEPPMPMSLTTVAGNDTGEEPADPN